MNNRKFAGLTELERRNLLGRIIRVRTGDALTREQVKGILRTIDVDEQYSIEAVDREEFIRVITLAQEQVMEREGLRITKTTGQKVFGMFQFGHSIKKSGGKRRIVGMVQKGTLTDTCQPAAVILKIQNTGCCDISVPLEQKKIVIYVPENAATQAS